MVRVPGSSGDSGFHRESQEDVQMKIEQGNEMSSDPGSTDARSADWQSAWRNSVDGNEEDLDPDPDLEEKPHPPYEDDGDQDGSGWSVEDLKYLYHRKELRDFVRQDPVMKILKLKRIPEPKDPVTASATVTNKLDAVAVMIRLLKEVGMIPGSFETDDVFDLDLTVIQATSRDPFGKLKILVGEAPQIADPVSSPQTDAVDNMTVSSHYASAAEDGSDTSSEPRRMSLGPSGAAMLEARSKISRPSPARSGSQPKGSTPTYQATFTSSSDRSAGTLQKFFNVAMELFLAEQQAEVRIQSLPNLRIADHEMLRWSLSDHRIADPVGNTIRTTSTSRYPPKKL
ncbi:hypothetical protein PHMEG_00035811 [Phytophthora megakarya]|uniref:Eukaryotic/viral aspartic protease n=1 Tax=Phytophthora megakarya TaxID=4795 RepID=A0A225UNF8_9STRA|nr:hypothetical protein PHMEG_00035811 [Phytophthora megakarya]